MLKDREAYEAKLEAQLTVWGQDLEGFKGRAKELTVDGMMQYDRTLEAMKRKHLEAGVHLRNLKETRDETWDQVRLGTEKAWVEIKALFKP